MSIYPSCYTGEGKESAEDWLMEYSAVSEANQWDVVTKRIKVPAFLRGNALRWYYEVKPLLNDWAIFERKFIEQFRPADWKEQKKSLFNSIKQGLKEPVSDYILRFQSISSTIATLSEEAKLEKFVEGLVVEVRRWVLFGAPATLTRAQELAKRGEMCNSAEKPVNNNKKEVKDLMHESSFDMDGLAEKLSQLVIKKVASNHTPLANYSSEISCYSCGKAGHKSYHCTEKIEKSRPTKSLNSQELSSRGRQFQKNPSQN